MKHPFADPKVAKTFAEYPDETRCALLALRDLTLTTATQTPGVGRIEETLKWGQPAYLTPDTKSGSTIRIAPTKTGGFAIYTHCQTTILSDFQAIFPMDFKYEGNRAVHFKAGDDIPEGPIAQLIRSALTYHLNKG